MNPQIREKTAITYKEKAHDYFEDKAYIKAIVWYKKVLNLYPKDYITLFNIGISFYNMEKFSKAIVYLKSALKSNPHYANAYEVLAKAYLEAGRLKAIKTLDKAYKQIPDFKNSDIRKNTIVEITNPNEYYGNEY